MTTDDTTLAPPASTIGRQRYTELHELGLRFARPDGTADPSLNLAAEAFLFHEADLLDRRLHDDWFDLMADDIVYWVPITDEADPGAAVAVAFDDHRRLGDRIAWLATGHVYSHQPPSRTQRSISNVQVRPLTADRWWVRSAVVIHAHRRGRTDRFIGHYEHVLGLDAGQPVRIHQKKVILLDRDDFLHNLTIIL